MYHLGLLCWVHAVVDLRCVFSLDLIFLREDVADILLLERYLVNLLRDIYLLDMLVQCCLIVLFFFIFVGTARRQLHNFLRVIIVTDG